MMKVSMWRHSLAMALSFLAVQLLFEQFHIGFASMLFAVSGVSSSRDDDNDMPHFDAASRAPFQFASCLLVKDENILLPEWLAYHYTFLPLRRVIVAVDPFSITDPGSILDPYRRIGMNITIWRRNTEEYLYYWKHGTFFDEERPFDILANIPPNRNHTQIMLEWHRARQRAFYQACLRQLKHEGQTWTAMHDVDEFINFNFYNPRENYVASHCKGDTACMAAYKQSILDETHFRTNLKEFSTAAEYIHTTKTRKDLDQVFASREKSCAVVPRYLFPSASSGPEERLLLPPPLNVSYFHTVRYRHLNPETQTGKSIVDASRYNGCEIRNPHRIYNGTSCTGRNAFAHVSNTSFRVHHYVGSWESFRRPGFDSRGMQKFEARGRVGPNAWIDTAASARKTLWVSDFATQVGLDRAVELTQKLRVAAETEMERLW